MLSLSRSGTPPFRGFRNTTWAPVRPCLPEDCGGRHPCRPHEEPMDLYAAATKDFDESSGAPEHLLQGVLHLADAVTDRPIERGPRRAARTAAPTVASSRSTSARGWRTSSAPDVIATRSSAAGLGSTRTATTAVLGGATDRLMLAATISESSTSATSRTEPTIAPAAPPTATSAGAVRIPSTAPMVAPAAVPSWGRPRCSSTIVTRPSTKSRRVGPQEEACFSRVPHGPCGDRWTVPSTGTMVSRPCCDGFQIRVGCGAIGQSGSDDAGRRRGVTNAVSLTA